MPRIKSFQIDVPDLTNNIKLNNINDVVISSVANNDILIYDTSSGKWINVPDPGVVAATWGSIVGTISNQLDLISSNIPYDDSTTGLGDGSPTSVVNVQLAIEKIVSNQYYVNIITGVGSPVGITNTNIPAGWSTTYNSVGNFTITHNLTNTIVGLALIVMYNGAARVLNPTSITPNTITFQITDTLNAGVEGNVVGKLLF